MTLIGMHIAAHGPFDRICAILPICSVREDGGMIVLGLDIKDFGPLIAFVALMVTVITNMFTRRSSLRVERSSAYLNLELASSGVFKYEAEHSVKLAPYREMTVTEAKKKILEINTSHRMHAYNLYFQSLNLFEVCARFRRKKIIEKQVFASWVAWFYDTLDDWYFRDQWDDLRKNYTRDVRDIFDAGVALFAPGRFEDSEEADKKRRAQFYTDVAAIMKCSEIRKWKKELYPEENDRKDWLARALSLIGRLNPANILKPPTSSLGQSAETPAT